MDTLTAKMVTAAAHRQEQALLAEILQLRVALSMSQAETFMAYETLAKSCEHRHAVYMRGKGRDPAKYESEYSLFARTLRIKAHAIGLMDYPA
jgi:hypothetical protein